MARNLGFSEKESGVGGIEVVVPRARSEEGGSEGRRDRMCEEPMERLSGKTYWQLWSAR